jgi:hypothetical protein
LHRSDVRGGGFPFQTFPIRLTCTRCREPCSLRRKLSLLRAANCSVVLSLRRALSLLGQPSLMLHLCEKTTTTSHLQAS